MNHRAAAIALEEFGRPGPSEPTDTIALASPVDSAKVRIVAYDLDGHARPLDASALDMEIPEGVSVRPAPDGALYLSGVEGAAGLLRIHGEGQHLEAAVTVGAQHVELLDLTDTAEWRTDHNRAAPPQAEPCVGPTPGTHGLRLSYDFTRDLRIRDVQAIPPATVSLPGRPQAVTIWLHGAGQGEWPRLRIRDGSGAVGSLDGEHLHFHGWRRVSFPVPSGMPHPLTLERIRFVEIRPEVSYHGQVVIGPVGAIVPPEVEAPARHCLSDPVLAKEGELAERPLRIAVMSDAQFVARKPHSELVTAAVRIFQEMVAAHPALIVINGDLVDEGAPEDLALAREVINRGIGDRVPWIYVPGNHEILGGSIGNFITEFGPVRRVETVQQTRVLTLDSSTGHLRQPNLDQVGLLERRLAEAAGDPAVTGVLVFAHHPTRDPNPDGASRLLNRGEAAELEALMARFRRQSGKSIAYMAGHAGTFHAQAIAGVSHIVGGNSGKAPASTPERGGFTGWYLLGIDPAAGVIDPELEAPRARISWLRAEIRRRS